MKKRLNLEELSLELPKIETNEARFLLGGDDYADSTNNCNCPQGAESVDTSSSTSENNNIDPPLPDTTNYDSQDYDPVENEQDQDDNEQNNEADNQQADPYYIKPLNQLPQIEHQLTNSMCVAGAFEYIREIFTGINDQGTYLTEVGNFYQSISGNFLAVSGVELTYMQQMVDNFFHSNQLSTTADLLQSLQDGNPVLGMQLFPDGTGHAITIVGVNPDNGAIMYADTITGLMLNTIDNPINLIGMWEITGVKP